MFGRNAFDSYVYSFAQERVVKGQVVDETGEPVMGATVVVEGSTSNGVITDIDGNYTITISGKRIW